MSGSAEKVLVKAASADRGGPGTPSPPGSGPAATLDEYSREDLADQLIRLRADFENFRRRVARERAEDEDRVLAVFVGRLLPVLDALDGALSAPADGAAAAYRRGVAQIRDQLLGLLRPMDFEEVEGVRCAFDPEVHEAVGTREDGYLEPGTVAEVVRKGYRIKDRLLRPALVRVAARQQGGEADRDAQ